MEAPIAPMAPPTVPPRGALPSSKRVEPAPSARSAADRPQSFAAENAAELESRMLPERTIERDEATGSFVYRLIDVATGAVTLQTPSEARLKMRAYLDGLAARRESRGSFEATA